MCRKDAKKGACLSVVGTGGGRDVGSQRSSPLSCAGAPDEIRVLMLTAALSLGSAVALGLARFSYALLLPAMQRDLGWSFATAGTMNTANALGYLLGALAFPRLSRRWTPCALFRFGCIATATTVALSSVVAKCCALHPALAVHSFSSGAACLRRGSRQCHIAPLASYSGCITVASVGVLWLRRFLSRSPFVRSCMVGSSHGSRLRLRVSRSRSLLSRQRDGSNPVT